MTHIRRYPLLSHLRAEPNQYILHYRKGQLVREGAGLAYWFSPLAASVAQIPNEDVETTFVLKERSRDLQDVTVQCALVYRCADAKRLVGRVNFAISLTSGTWLETPLERLRNLWSQRAQAPARAYLTSVELAEAIRGGAEAITRSLEETLRADEEIEAMGLAFVSAQIQNIAPSAELEKALQTPTREAIQQKADEATFERRALAVEKERAIKQNELSTEIELARRQEDLIRQEGANRLQSIQQEAGAEKARIEAEVERRRIAVEAEADEVRRRAEAQAAAQTLIAEADNAAEERRVAIWGQAPGRVHFGLALQELAKNVPKIEHLNLTPDLVGDAVQKLLRDLIDEKK